MMKGYSCRTYPSQQRGHLLLLQWVEEYVAVILRSVLQCIRSVLQRCVERVAVMHRVCCSDFEECFARRTGFVAVMYRMCCSDVQSVLQGVYLRDLPV